MINTYFFQKVETKWKSHLSNKYIQFLKESTRFTNFIFFHLIYCIFPIFSSLFHCGSPCKALLFAQGADDVFWGQPGAVGENPASQKG